MRGEEDKPTCQQLVLAEVFQVPSASTPTANGAVLDSWLLRKGYRRIIVENWWAIPPTVLKCAAVFSSKQHLHATHLGLACRTLTGYSLTYADGYGQPLAFEFYEALK